LTSPRFSTLFPYTTLFRSNFEIWVMDADGSNKQRLTDHPAMDSNPVWSADGSAILFESWRDGNLEIYRMNADGSDVRRLTSNERSEEHTSELQSRENLVCR